MNVFYANRSPHYALHFLLIANLRLLNLKHHRRRICRFRTEEISKKKSLVKSLLNCENRVKYDRVSTTTVVNSWRSNFMIKYDERGKRNDILLSNCF